MLTRRVFAVSLAAAVGLSSRAMAQQRLTQEDLLRFEPLGQVTLLHFTDIHAQLMPVHFREPSCNHRRRRGAGLPPHLTGATLLAALRDRAAAAPRPTR